MKAAYRVLAYLVALEVVIQAAAIAWAVFGESKFIAGGGTVNQALIDSQTADFDGALGYAVHGINGQMITPLIVVLFLISSFFAKVPNGVLWAGIVVLLVALQVALGIFGHDIPFVGLLHGINAIAIFAVAVIAARRVSTDTASSISAGRTSVA